MNKSMYILEIFVGFESKACSFYLFIFFHIVPLAW